MRVSYSMCVHWLRGWQFQDETSDTNPSDHMLSLRAFVRRSDRLCVKGRGGSFACGRNRCQIRPWLFTSHLRTPEDRIQGSKVLGSKRVRNHRNSYHKLIYTRYLHNLKWVDDYHSHCLWPSTKLLYMNCHVLLILEELLCTYIKG